MSKMTKKQLQRDINNLATELTNLKIELLEKKVISDEPKPQLKQLTQSVFDGLDEKWRFAAIDSDGDICVYDGNPTLCDYEWVTMVGVKFLFLARGYDASNWQNSLIERDTAKELLEVDLSSELTGSDLCREMLARGDKYVMCAISDVSDADALDSMVVDNAMSSNEDWFDCFDGRLWKYAVPINNQGEPLTASEVGL